MTEWQPIETAPDNVRQAGAMMEGSLGRFRMRFFSDTEMRDGKPFAVTYVLWLGFRPGDRATHWWTAPIFDIPSAGGS